MLDIFTLYFRTAGSLRYHVNISVFFIVVVAFCPRTYWAECNEILEKSDNVRGLSASEYLEPKVMSSRNSNFGKRMIKSNYMSHATTAVIFGYEVHDLVDKLSDSHARNPCTNLPLHR